MMYFVFERSLSSVQEPLQKLTGTTAADKTNGSSHRNPVDAALEKANYDVQKSGRVSVRDLESIVNQIVSLSMSRALPHLSTKINLTFANRKCFTIPRFAPNPMLWEADARGTRRTKNQACA